MITRDGAVNFKTRKTVVARRRLQSFVHGWPLKAGILLVAFLALWLGRHTLAGWLQFITDREAFQAYIQGFGLWGPLVLAFFNLIHVVVALVPGHAVVIAAGYIYGLLPGFLLNWSSIVLASMLAFYLARWYGRPLVARLAPLETVERWDKVARKHGFAFFLTSYLLPLFPADTMNFVAGLSALPPRQFLIANLIGRVPITLFVTAVGAYSLELTRLKVPGWVWVAFILVSIAAYAGWRHYFHNYQRMENLNSPGEQNRSSPPFSSRVHSEASDAEHS